LPDFHRNSSKNLKDSHYSDDLNTCENRSMHPLPQLSLKYVNPHICPQGVAYQDGQYIPVSEAKISVLDYGFLHSDATYDTVHVWDGAFFRLDPHLDRFFSNLGRLRMQIPYDREQVRLILHNCVALSGHRNAYVEMLCTRGGSPNFSRDPRDAVNRFAAFAVPFGSVANEEQLARGLRVQITDIVRIPPDSIDPSIKNYHWLDLTAGLFDAYDQGAETAFLKDARGNITEGPGFNVFALCGEQLVTPLSGVLPGITRRTVFDICQTLGIAAEACELSPETLMQAGEVFITSTAGGIMPVTQLCGVPVGDGRPGPMTERIGRTYWEWHRDPAYSESVAYPQ
jgi:branched-chain amino acid aminotransferase